MFFPKCAPNGILGVEGTLAYGRFKTTIYPQTVKNNYLLRCVITGSTGIYLYIYI
jgi:hypothetical protein